MASKDPQSGGKKGGWRGGARTPAKGKRPADAKAAGWAKKKDRQHEQARGRHRLRVAGGFLLVAALIVGFVLYLIFIPVRTPFLAAVVTNYDAPIAPNAWAEEDVEQLAALDPAEILEFSRVPWESREQGLQSLRKALDAARPGGPNKDLVIVYLSMHGVVNAKGEPCLLPPGASRFESTSWLPVRDLLQEVFLEDRPNRPPDQVKKLLILDSNRMDMNWSLGLLYNAFAERLPAVVEEARVPNLVVLSSAGPGQIGHAAPELAGSVFGYFLRQGLKGAADTAQTGNHDEEVSLQELYAYLRAYVRQWVTEYRSDVQEPMLLPQKADMPLVYASGDSEASLPAVELRSDRRWNEIRSLWELHQQLEQRSVYRLLPLKWAEFEHKLIRLEELALAGRAYKEEYDNTRDELLGLAKELEEDPLPRDLAAYSLPLATWLRGEPDFDQQRQAFLDRLSGPVKEQLEAKPETAKPDPSSAPEAGQDQDALQGKTAPQEPAAKPNEPQTKGKKAAKATKSEAAPKAPASKPKAKIPPPSSYLAASAAAWDWLLRDPSRQRLSTALQVVDGANRRLKTDLGGVHLLRMVELFLDREVDFRYVGSALRAHGAAEQAAAPRDQRVHYLIHSLVDQADAQRRLAEDKLFVGTADALAGADRLWTEAAGRDGAGGAYQKARDLADQAAAAFRLRDQAWAEIPYLAEWILARLHQETASEADDLRQLIEATHDLGRQLDRSLASGRLTAELRETQAEVREKLTTLKKAFDAQCYQLRVIAGEDKQTLQAIAAVLAVPLVTGDHRSQLRDKFLRIADAEAETPGSPRQLATTESAGAKPPAAQAGDPASQYLDRLRQWEQHPALAILSRAQTSADPKDRATAAVSPLRPSEPSQEKESAVLARETLLKALAEQGEEVRGRLLATQTDAEARRNETIKMLQQPTSGQSAATVRAGCSQADRLVRASAALLGNQLWSRPDDDPVQQLRRLDLHYLLLWHARRTLEDFWGPAPGTQTPHFQIAARHYLDSARQLCPNTAMPCQAEFSLVQLLGQREEAARNGLELEAPDLTIVEDVLLVEHHVSVALAQNLPPGEAALYLQSPDERPFGIRNLERQRQRRMGLGVQESGGNESPGYLVESDSLAGVSVGQAVAVYRGHVYGRTFAVVHSTASFDVVHLRPTYRKPTVTVYGEAREPGIVVFIVDYSGSMGYHLGRDESQPRRIEVARSALDKILLRLVRTENPYRVGVRFYGRRAWFDPRTYQVVTDPPGLNLHPAEDVELILRPGRFGQTEFEEIRKELQSEPKGITPLYYAIAKSIREDFRNATASEPRHIVAITDGFNNQEGGPGEVLTDHNDVAAALKRPENRQLRLDIVSFDVTATQDWEREGEKELESLAKLTGGKVHSARNLRELLGALEASLRLSQYVVVPTEGPPRPDPQPVELGTTWVIDQAAGRPVAHVVKLEHPEGQVQARVETEGGEALELKLGKDPQTARWRLAHWRYEEGLRDYRDNVPDPLDAGRRFYVGAHLPERQGQAVRFRISLQNADQTQFSPRPAEAWVRIVPVLPDGSEATPVYSFYDLEFEPERPVPVLSCTAPKWPSKAKTARIQLWCKFRKTPAEEIPVADLRQASRQIGGVTVELEAKPGPKPGDPYQVIVVERHPPASDLGTVKVEMDPPPAKVIHRFSPDAALVRDTFLYDGAGAAEINRYKILLTAREKLVDQAITTGEPLKVTVPPEAASTGN